MPTYQVKPDCTIEHEGNLYLSGTIIELPSELGAFHEPNLVAAAPVLPDEDEDEEEEYSYRKETLDIIVAA